MRVQTVIGLARVVGGQADLPRDLAIGRRLPRRDERAIDGEAEVSVLRAQARRGHHIRPPL